MAGKREPRNYVNNAHLLEEIRKSKEIFRGKNNPDKTPAECLTPKLVSMLIALVENYGKKYNWRNYSYLEDMKAEAIANLCQNALKFDEAKAGDQPNPFSYYTQITHRSFLTYLGKENGLRDIRDDLIETMDGEDFKPSHHRQLEQELDHLDYAKHSHIQPKKRGRKKAAAKKP